MKRTENQAASKKVEGLPKDIKKFVRQKKNRLVPVERLTERILKAIAEQ